MECELRFVTCRFFRPSSPSLDLLLRFWLRDSHNSLLETREIEGSKSLAVRVAVVIHTPWPASSSLSTAFAQADSRPFDNIDPIVRGQKLLVDIGGL